MENFEHFKRTNYSLLDCTPVNKFGNGKKTPFVQCNTTINFDSLEDEHMHYFTIRLSNKYGYPGSLSEKFEVPLTEPSKCTMS